MPFENFNIELFQFINAPPNPAPWIVLVAGILAEWVVYGTAIWMVIAWIRTGLKFRFVLLDGFLSALVALGIAQAIGIYFYHPRPFEVNLGHQFLAHGTETSFPSDHALFMFALTFTFLINNISGSWGWLFMLFGLGVAWSRIYLGVHFPFDMVGAFVISLICATLVKLVSPMLQTGIYPLLLKLYEATISVLRLPEGIFPRLK